MQIGGRTVGNSLIFRRNTVHLVLLTLIISLSTTNLRLINSSAVWLA